MTDIPRKSNGNNDWVAYRALVLHKLEALFDNDIAVERDIKEIKDVQIIIRLDVQRLQIKAAIWGGVTAFVVSSAVAGGIAYLF